MVRESSVLWPGILFPIYEYFIFEKTEIPSEPLKIKYIWFSLQLFTELLRQGITWTLLGYFPSLARR